MTQPAFDPTQFGGQPSTPPIPMVVCWDDLDPTSYVAQLTELAEWITWFRTTYRIPATVLPPCWFTHPAIREDIGHLWTGWLLTRHPDAGVGMIGLDWDQRREATINRLREATAITGCTASRHQAEPGPTGPASNPIEHPWHDHLDAQTQLRARDIAIQAATQIVADILNAAELRHDLAPAILAEIADDPTITPDHLTHAVAERLRELALTALDRAATGATDTASTIADAAEHTASEAAVAEARDDIAKALARSAILGQAIGTLDRDLSTAWLAAVEQLLPAANAAERATAAAGARTTAVDRRTATRRRHPDIDDLLP